MRSSMLRKASIRYPSDVCTLSFEKYKEKSLRGISQSKKCIINVVLSSTAYKYAPNLESLLTQQYVCVMCTLWSDNTCVFTRFRSVKNANTRLIWSYVTPQCKSLNNTGDWCPRYAKPPSKFSLFNSILKRFYNQLFNIWS